MLGALYDYKMVYMTSTGYFISQILLSWFLLVPSPELTPTAPCSQPVNGKNGPYSVLKLSFPLTINIILYMYTNILHTCIYNHKQIKPFTYVYAGMYIPRCVYSLQHCTDGSKSLCSCIHRPHLQTRSQYRLRIVGREEKPGKYSKSSHLSKAKLAFCPWQNHGGTHISWLKQHLHKEPKETGMRGVNGTDFQCTRLEDFNFES